mgnify:CR=1 FL=1
MNTHNITVSAAEARRLIAAFAAFEGNLNVNAMRSTFRKLRDAFLQASLILHLGGIPQRDAFLVGARQAVAAATEEVRVRKALKRHKKG